MKMAARAAQSDFFEVNAVSKLLNLLHSPESKRVTVIGLGISNLPLVEYLLALGGCQITVRDKKQPDFSNPRIAALRDAGVNFCCGENYLENIEADILFRSPGVRPWEAGIAAAVKAGALLTSEMELFFSLCPCPILGVTGSDGKTTTTTLLSLLLRGAGRRVFVGGNIGKPLLPHLSEMRAEDFAVVELSSFQLYTMQQSPAVAVITNLAPNHLDWHPDFDDYCRAKANIFRHPGCRCLITNADNAPAAALADSAQAEGLSVVRFSSTLGETLPGEALFEKEGVICRRHDGAVSPLLAVSDIRIRGRHNVENYMAAMAAAAAALEQYPAGDAALSREVISDIASSFPGVEHRIEFVRERRGVKFYNSSIDSSPSRTIAALRSFEEPLVVICCGRDKHVPFDDMAAELCRRARAVVLTGELAPQVKAALLACRAYRPGHPEIREAASFDEAAALAAETAKPSESVLLSPGGTSFDCFPNFEVRGRRFKDLILALPD